MKHQAKKKTSTAKHGVAGKVRRTSRAASKHAKAIGTKASRVVKGETKKARATLGTVRTKARKLVSKLQHAQHGAADVATRIGSTMETIGGAIVSLIDPHDDRS